MNVSMKTDLTVKPKTRVLKINGDQLHKMDEKIDLKMWQKTEA